MNIPYSDEIDDVHWDEACRRAEAICSFLARPTDNKTTKDVAVLASELGLSQATTYRLIKLFRADGTVLSLVDRRPGRPTGYRALDEKREQIIHTAIRSFYMKQNRPNLSQLVREVQSSCISAGLKLPHRRTVLARVEDIDIKKRAKRRGEMNIVKSTTAVPGTYNISRPLEVVQIDHTKADIFVVDEETQQPIGRPWLTLAMDVCSRMITGFYLTMEAPSRLSTSICLLHSVFDKTAWLRERGIKEPWPVAGLPDLIHVDNGADFRSRAFIRGCQDAGMGIKWRPPGKPHYGGHIERLIGTQMGKLHLLPGTTFSNEQDLGEYDSKRHSALTLRELERYIALDIVGFYHQTIHSSLGRPPIAVWREREGEIPLRLPQDRLRFWLSFLPEQNRTLRTTGIHLFGLRYWASALTTDVGRTKRRLLIKYDPRDMARVFVQMPSGNYVEARLADVTLPSVTLHEAQSARRALLAKGRREVDTHAIIRTAIAQRKLVKMATHKTDTTRRIGTDSQKQKLNDGGWGSLRGVDSSKPVPFIEDAE